MPLHLVVNTCCKFARSKEVLFYCYFRTQSLLLSTSAGFHLAMFWLVRSCIYHNECCIHAYGHETWLFTCSTSPPPVPGRLFRPQVLVLGCFVPVLGCARIISVQSFVLAFATAFVCPLSVERRTLTSQIDVIRHRPVLSPGCTHLLPSGLESNCTSQWLTTVQCRKDLGCI